MGRHGVDFPPEGNRRRVRVGVGLAVGFGPSVLYRYPHRATEQWEDGNLRSLQAETDDDGRKLKVSASAANGRIEISGSEGEGIGPADPMPGSYWDSRLLVEAVLLHLHYRIVQPNRMIQVPAEDS